MKWLTLLFLALMFPAPVFPQINTDAGFIKAAGCWGSPSSYHSDDRLCGVKPVPFHWPWHLSWDISPGSAFPTPQWGYLGAPVTRLRYESLSEGGMVLQINTFDTSSNTTPWRYNFQAFQTNLPTFIPLTNGVKVNFDFKVRKDWHHYNAEELAPKDVPGELGERRRPWIHMILGAVFSKGDQIWFIEIVPFYREGKFGSGLGKILGSAGSPNARLSITDPRLTSALDTNDVAVLGKRRTVTVDFKKAFRKVYPAVGIDGVKYNGSYIGAEQFGKIKLAVNFKRLAIN